MRQHQGSPRKPKHGAVGLLGVLIVGAGLLWNMFNAGQLPLSNPDRPQSNQPTRGQTDQQSAAERERNRGGSGRGEIAQMLEQLPIQQRANGDTYDRNFFGEGWIDTDGNTCFTRADILTRDLEAVKKKGRCKVVSGVLHDPYTNKTIAYQSGKETSEAVQIDHVVALRDAWVTGAQDWTEAKRIEFANDPLNLLAVEGETNDDKGHKNAADWLPPNQAFHCEYVARQVAVKDRYGLWVTPAEHRAMSQGLQGCPSGMRVDGDTIVGA